MHMGSTGLVFPEDLDAWREWSRKRNRVRFGLASARAFLRQGPPAPRPMLYLPLIRCRILTRTEPRCCRVIRRLALLLQVTSAPWSGIPTHRCLPRLSRF